MKVAFAGDWHGNGYWAREAIKYAAEQGAEIIVHLGDFGYDFTRDYRQTVEAALRRAGLTLQFVDGNHENFPKLYGDWSIGDDGRREISPRVHHLPRGYRWEWDGVKFLALGGAFSVDRRWRELGTSWWTEETITEEDMQRCMADGETDILISHDTPAGYAIPGTAGNVSWIPHDALEQAYEHRRRLAEVVDVVAPKVIFHGHYHSAYQRRVEYGYGPASIYGLDCDGSSLRTNIQVVDLATAL